MWASRKLRPASWEYLLAPLSDDELAAMVDLRRRRDGGLVSRDMGAVMKLLQPNRRTSRRRPEWPPPSRLLEPTGQPLGIDGRKGEGDSSVVRRSRAVVQRGRHCSCRGYVPCRNSRGAWIIETARPACQLMLPRANIGRRRTHPRSRYRRPPALVCRSPRRGRVASLPEDGVDGDRSPC